PFTSHATPLYPHSSPTRRSSDLPTIVRAPLKQIDLFPRIQPHIDHENGPIRRATHQAKRVAKACRVDFRPVIVHPHIGIVHRDRSEEHTSELQSRENLVCRLLLE